MRSTSRKFRQHSRRATDLHRALTQSKKPQSTCTEQLTQGNLVASARAAAKEMKADHRARFAAAQVACMPSGAERARARASKLTNCAASTPPESHAKVGLIESTAEVPPPSSAQQTTQLHIQCAKFSCVGALVTSCKHSDWGDDSLKILSLALIEIFAECVPHRGVVLDPLLPSTSSPAICDWHSSAIFEPERRPA